MFCIVPQFQTWRFTLSIIVCQFWFRIYKHDSNMVNIFCPNQLYLYVPAEIKIPSRNADIDPQTVATEHTHLTGTNLDSVSC